MTTFYSRFEKALRKSATAAAAGRLQGSTDVILADVANPAVTKIAKAPYELFGPGDVQRLAAGAITRRFPAPNASDAEVTKLALVEFAADDLPWRYTPRLPSGGELRPWVVLVVGQRAPDEIVLRPDGRVTLGLTAQQHHVLSESAQWAHVQQVDGHEPIGARGGSAQDRSGTGSRRTSRLRGEHRIRRVRRPRLHRDGRRQLERQRARHG